MFEHGCSWLSAPYDFLLKVNSAYLIGTLASPACKTTAYSGHEYRASRFLKIAILKTIFTNKDAIYRSVSHPRKEMIPFC
jgi:hypothetical protein